MKKILFLLAFVAFGMSASSQEIMRIHQSGTSADFNLYENDSIYFNDDHSSMYFSNNGTVNTYVTADVDSITFLHDAMKSVFIHYDGDNVTVDNPLTAAGVAVSTTGGMVTVTSTSLVSHLNFVLSGSSTNGNFKIYSDSPFNVLLNNLSLTNPAGPALNSQSERQMNIILVEGTINNLSDGTTYGAAPVVAGVTEDQKATLFSEGDMDIIGGGTLNIDGNGSAQHAMASDKDLEIKQGSITITSVGLDGIHASDRLDFKGGSTSIQSADDGASAGGKLSVDCGLVNIITAGADTKAMTSDTLVVVTGGSVIIAHSGAQSKGISSTGNVRIEGGSVQVTNSGASVLTALGSGMDVAHSAAITADGNIEISNGNVTVVTSALGGRAFKSDVDFIMNGGTVVATCSGNGATYTNSTGTADAYHSTCIKTNGDVIVNGGELTTTASGSGGHAIEADGNITIGDGTTEPVIDVLTSGTNITITAGGGGGGPGGGNTGNYDEAKALKTDMDFTINSGTINIDSNDDGVKALQGATVNGGTLNIIDSKEGVESPNITMNGGTSHVKSSDDGLNATAGTGGESSDGSMLAINGGYVHLDASAGDPMDSNGEITVTGGLCVVHGPQSSPEVGIDVNGTALVHGGEIVVSGTNSNMTEGFTNASTQRSLIMKSTTSLPANTIIHLEDANGVEIFAFKPIRSYYSIVYSSPELANGTYRLYSSGSHTGTVTDGFITGGAYTAGTLESTITISGMVTTVNF